MWNGSNQCETKFTSSDYQTGILSALEFEDLNDGLENNFAMPLLSLFDFYVTTFTTVARDMSDSRDEKDSYTIHLVIHIIFLHFLLVSSSTVDQSALLALKTHITSDPGGFLQNWTSSSSVCSWFGVTCGVHRRVTGLNISKLDVTGTIPSHLGNLSFLVSIDISWNNFGRTLPQDLSHLRRLSVIILDYNNFTGEVPTWFSSLPQLQFLSAMNNSFTSLSSFLHSFTNKSNLITLNMSCNHLQGEIPESIGNLHNLKALVMYGNRFTGFIPRAITNMSSLEILHLPFNSFQGMIPEGIGNLHNLYWLDMQHNRLTGSIPPSIFNISTLKHVAFSYNSLSGTLPDNMCLQLPVLKKLALSNNEIHGHIPSNFSSCPQLQTLDLLVNHITGTIPQGIGSLEMLETLYLGSNELTGQIPSEIGKLHNLRELGMAENMLMGSIPLTIFNISFLQNLLLSRNEFSGFLPRGFGNLTKLKNLISSENKFKGVIPLDINKLTELEILDLGTNRLSGPIPSSILNISTLRVIQLLHNQFTGNLPENVGAFLPNLEYLILAENKMHGVLPNSISNSSQLKTIELSRNSFSGSIPNSLGNLKFLQYLNLLNNNFTSESASSELTFITSLTSCRDLKGLGISLNPLHGILPASVGNLSSSLQSIFASGCKIQGYITEKIGNLSSLLHLYLDGNNLSGEIPNVLDTLSSLQQLSLGDNQLSGSIPNGLCKSENLGQLDLSQNHLTGSVLDCLGNVSSLRLMYLNSNNLTYGIPASIWNLLDILELDMSSNSLNGSLSPQIEQLKATVYINLSMNQFSNDIPNTIGGLLSLQYLDLQYNRFQGSIPESVGSMISLISLDLSHNMLTRAIPKSLESLTLLKYFNVSSNELSGSIPTGGPFTNFTSQSFASNTALCGPPRFHVLPCKEFVNRSKKKNVLKAELITPVGFGILMFVGAMVFLIIRHQRNKKSVLVSHISESKPSAFSYYALLQAAKGYSEDNLLGRGSFGSVYKGVFEDGTVVAIKVFDMLLEAASKTFDAECEVLRNLRHRNLIKIISCCSNHDFKALILEYMPNGSLENWLHSDNRIPDIMQRLNIMIDVASALEYLHHGYAAPVVHCDLKPSNILIDENMVAHVSDFGITKILGEQKSITCTRTLATLGYMAPEYALEGRVSTKCDVYSYGILLLETFTGKRPSDEKFVGDMTIKNWVKDSLPDAPGEVIDCRLTNPNQMDFSKILCCTLSVLELALQCSADSPRARINLKDVVEQLKRIKAEYVLFHSQTLDMVLTDQHL